MSLGASLGVERSLTAVSTSANSAFLNNYTFEIDLEGEPDALSLASVRRHYYAIYYVLLFSTRMDSPWILNHEY